MIVKQLRQNLLAIISLLVALTALGYNTWRNEQTEHNRNIRQAGFEMLLHVSELQKITYLAHYDRDLMQGSPRKGWTQVLVLRDLAHLMESERPVRAESLLQAWRDNWASLGQEDDQAVEQIDAALDNLRNDVLQTLAGLE